MPLWSKKVGEMRINIKYTYFYKKIHWKDKSKANEMVIYVGGWGRKDRYGIKVSQRLPYYRVLAFKPCKCFTFSKKNKINFKRRRDEPYNPKYQRMNVFIKLIT